VNSDLQFFFPNHQSAASMGNIGIKNPKADLKKLGLKNIKTAFWNISREELMEQTISRKQGILTDTGALSIHTGEFTGRTPKDRFIVKDSVTSDTIDWGNVNQAISSENYDILYGQITNYFSRKEVFVRDNFVCADPDYKLCVRSFNELPSSSLFADNMFMRPTQEEILTIKPDWTILCAPGFKTPHPKQVGVNRGNFVVMNFAKRQIIIGGTGYTGEIKKGIFAVLNFELPVYHKVLPMHCSANVGRGGDAAVFFGLSGTGKTTLSADPDRHLIGDDEHGWSKNGVFNFEGGCYAKTINITDESEPEIFRAIKHGAILENIGFMPNSRVPDYADKEITENTRVSYPIYHIPGVALPSKSGHPNNVFFLTCDAFGVLPPISKLSPGQAMYHFISGYTAKIPGTEDGVAEPESTFSACFGAPFLPLHPTKYATMLGEKMKQHKVNIWLVNTGWTGGEFGQGTRMKLKFTRAMIAAALTGELNKSEFIVHEIFGLEMPTTCPNVPDELLNPRLTWKDKAAYDVKADELAVEFNKNFDKYAAAATPEMLAAAPKALVS
jgi:phosphoenolpyruvate carboxykinase (ATP)